MKSASHLSIAGVSAALVAGCAYGVGGTVSQIVKSQGFALNHIVVAQFLAATIILGFFVVVRFRPHAKPSEVIKLMLVGAMSVSSSYFYYYAIDYLSVGSAVAIQFQYVWIAVVLTSIAAKRLPSIWVAMSAVFIIAGSMLASGLVDEMLSGKLVMNPVGLMCGFGCALTYGLFIFLNGRVATDVNPVARTFFMVLAGLIMSVVIAPDFFTGSCDVIAIIPGGIAMGLIMSVIPCVCLAVAAVKIPGGIVAILTSLELPTAVLSGAVILGETVTPLVIIGVVIILASIVLSEADSLLRRAKPEAHASRQ